jgi:tetratricopeptide (TPR) repeat protein
VFPALAERAYIAAAKVFLQGSPDDHRLGAFLSRLDAFSEANPSMLYLLYYRVQLRLKTGQLADALHILLPFARQKQRDFWVWDLMADLHPDKPDLQLACYARALTCKGKPEFLVKLRQKLARLLVQQGRWAEARTEIDEVLRVRTAHQWRIPAEIADWVRASDYAKVEARVPDAEAYQQMAALAAPLLFDPRAAVLGVVSGINEQKRTAHFVVSEEVSGGFGYAALGFEPAVGDCLLLHLEPRTAPDGTAFQKVVHASPTAAVATPLLRTVTGIFKKVGTVGFVGNAFVEGALASQLEEGKTYLVQAVKSFNARRQTWGWKVFRVLN